MEGTVMAQTHTVVDEYIRSQSPSNSWPPSTQTLEAGGNVDDELPTEVQDDGGEKGNNARAPKAVGFFSNRLATVRREVLGLWARTSQSSDTEDSNKNSNS